MQVFALPITGVAFDGPTGLPTTTSYGVTRIAIVDSYSPTVIPTDASSSGLGRQTTPTSIAARTIPTELRGGIWSNYTIQKRAATYDYDPCTGIAPDHDLVTNSLSDVCHFVANAKSYFVSLRPTPAAYMPSWSGYVVQVIVSAWNLTSLVPPIAQQTLTFRAKTVTKKVQNGSTSFCSYSIS
jgi:hypothetical protein